MSGSVSTAVDELSPALAGAEAEGGEAAGAPTTAPPGPAAVSLRAQVCVHLGWATPACYQSAVYQAIFFLIPDFLLKLNSRVLTLCVCVCVCVCMCVCFKFSFVF